MIPRAVVAVLQALNDLGTGDGAIFRWARPGYELVDITAQLRAAVELVLERKL